MREFMYTYVALRYLFAITTLWAVVFETTRVVLLGFGCGYSLKLCESCMGYLVPLHSKVDPVPAPAIRVFDPA